jgi:hypothetical protein
MNWYHTKNIEFVQRPVLQLEMTEQEVLYLFKQHFKFVQNVQFVFQSPYVLKAHLFDSSHNGFISFDIKFSDYDLEMVHLGPTDGTLIKKNIPNRAHQKSAVHHWFLDVFEIFSSRNFKALNLHVAAPKEHNKNEKRDFSFYIKPPLSFRLTGNYLNLNPEVRRKFRD